MAALVLAALQPGLGSARAADDASRPTAHGGDLDHANAQLRRFQDIFAYSNRYDLPAGLAAAIYDEALGAGLDADLAFRLVRIESDFNERAVSPVGAVGLTQLMPSTAREIEPGVTREMLFRRDVNLRIGFKYLRGLIGQYRGNVATALLVYNRGPVAVTAARARGEDPSNGYERAVLRGYRGRGVTD